jgi:hypothetical protein
MPRKSKPRDPGPESGQLAFDFRTVIDSGKVLSREEVMNRRQPDDSVEYSPIDRTAEYMQRAVKMEEAWETTVQEARERLLTVDPRELYFEFLRDLKSRTEKGGAQAERYAKLLENVAFRGLGITIESLEILPPLKGGTRWRVRFEAEAIRKHIGSHIVGKHFLNPVQADNDAWGTTTPLIGASDISQHRSAVPVPARFFKRSVPFVLNNAAGALFKRKGNMPKYDNVFNPKPDENLLRWMLIDPSYQDELQPEDYERCIASAMDVGQFKFDLEFLMKGEQHPHIIFRDGSLFPQDAYLDNYVVEGRRGAFTREAIIELLNCLLYARELGLIYCGVSKSIQLKVYSAVVDWFIAKEVDKDWEVGNYTLNDGQAMSILLASPDFVADNLQQVVATCLVKRAFTTRANLNTRAGYLSRLDDYYDSYAKQHPETDITPFRRLCEIAQVYMCFIGHSKSPQQQIPRYEFFYADAFGPIQQVTDKVFAALRYCGLMSDHDHSIMSDKPITYLLPSVTQQAHLLSKDVGRYIDSATGQWIMARYRDLISK